MMAGDPFHGHRETISTVTRLVEPGPSSMVEALYLGKAYTDKKVYAHQKLHA